MHHFWRVIQHCPLDGSSTAVLGQQRSMDVDTAVPGQFQHPFGQNLAVSDYDNQIRCAIFDHFKRLIIAQAGRLEDRDLMSNRQLFDRRRHQLISSALGFIRLGKDAGHRITGVQQLLQTGDREIGRPIKTIFISNAPLFLHFDMSLDPSLIFGGCSSGSSILVERCTIFGGSFNRLHW